MVRVWGTWDIDDDIKSGLGYFGVFISICLFLAPVKTFMRIHREHSTTEFSSVPYLSTFMNCWLWVFYAWFTGGVIASLITNLAGGGLASIYLAIFIYYCAGDREDLIARVAIGAGVLLLVLGLVWFYDQDNYFQGGKLSSFYFGLFAGMGSVAMYGSPLAIIRLVIKSRSSEFLPILVVLTGVLTSSSWTAYGLYLGDPWITFPNGLGALLGCIQVIVWWIYRDGPPDDINYNEISQDGFMKDHEGFGGR
jgi:solute carrier family 50 protein (sugar transporter)